MNLTTIIAHTWLMRINMGGWTRWLKPVFLSILGGRGGKIMRSGVQDQPGQNGETPFLLKLQKVARRGGRHL